MHEKWNTSPVQWSSCRVYRMWTTTTTAATMIPHHATGKLLVLLTSSVVGGLLAGHVKLFQCGEDPGGDLEWAMND